jgi:hypothetical protein
VAAAPGDGDGEPGDQVTTAVGAGVGVAGGASVGCPLLVNGTSRRYPIELISSLRTRTFAVSVVYPGERAVTVCNPTGTRGSVNPPAASAEPVKSEPTEIIAAGIGRFVVASRTRPLICP